MRQSISSMRNTLLIAALSDAIGAPAGAQTGEGVRCERSGDLSAKGATHPSSGS
jgi:hypothetical protein